MAAGSGLRSFHGAVSRLADRIGPPENVVRRTLNPVYTSLLRVLSGARGHPVDINGQVFRLDPQFRWLSGHGYEREVAEFLATRITPGQVCFDVGANVGIYVLQLSRWSAPGGRIVAFEPNPATLKVLRAHVAMNGLDSRVTIVPKGAGAGAGTATLYDTAGGSGLGRIGAPNPDIHGTVAITAIEVTAIDDFVRETAMIPDWILIDVEGYEFAALHGAVDTIRRHAPHVVVEVHPRLLSAESRAAGARLLEDLELSPVRISVAGRPETFVSLE